MQHRVPQFIEVEDKLFGPLTLKQFAYIFGGIGLSVIIWRTFSSTFIVLLLVSIVAGFVLALSFVKPNGKPFIVLVQNFFAYIFKPKQYVWKSPTQTETRQNIQKAQTDYDKMQKRGVVFKGKKIGLDQIRELANKLNNK
jgi:PrgI family protein